MQLQTALCNLRPLKAPPRMNLQQIATPDPAPSAQPFQFRLRVYYEDTDAGGIVYYANYLKFAERARTEWLRSLGVDQSNLRDADGVLFVVSSCEVQYHASARLDDLLTVQARLEKCGAATLLFAQQIWRGDTLLCSLKVRVASVGASDMRPRAMPKPLLQQLRALCSGTNEDKA